MQLRDVNVNTQSTAAGQRKVASPTTTTATTTATYVSPPRNPTVTAANTKINTNANGGGGTVRPRATAAAVVGPSPLPSSTVAPAPSGSGCHSPYSYAPAPATAHYYPVQQQQQDIKTHSHHHPMDAPVQYADECPCPPCAYYRAYYASQMSYTAAPYHHHHHDLHLQQQQQQLPLPAHHRGYGVAPAAPMVTGMMPILSLRSKTARSNTMNSNGASMTSMATTVTAAPSTTSADDDSASASFTVTNGTINNTAAAVLASVADDNHITNTNASNNLAMPAATAALEAFFTDSCGSVVAQACTAEGRKGLQSLLRAIPAVMAAPADEAQFRLAADALECILSECCDGVDAIALDEQGCHVLRALVYACASGEQTARIVAALHETLVLNMSTVSQYTRRTLQALCERGLADLSTLVAVLAANAVYLAATEQGCISLMRVYEGIDDGLRAQLVAPLLPTFHHIALDPFGNYVVQCAVEKSGPTVAAQYTVSCFAGHLLAMSCNKFASNVVEKVIANCYHVPAVRRLILDELVFNPAAIVGLVSDPYGNFVMQRILENTASAAELKRIADRLKPALPYSRYAQKIEAKMKQRRGTQQQQGGGNSNSNISNSNARARPAAPAPAGYPQQQQQQQQQQQYQHQQQPSYSSSEPTSAAMPLSPHHQQQYASASSSSFHLPFFQPSAGVGASSSAAPAPAGPGVPCYGPSAAATSSMVSANRSTSAGAGSGAPPVKLDWRPPHLNLARGRTGNNTPAAV